MIKVYFNNIKCLSTRHEIKKLYQDAINYKFENADELRNANFEVSIRYASAEEIRKLNKEYRDVDRKTDVLSFPLVEFNSEIDVEMAINESDAGIMLGDIIICKEVAKQQAKEYGHSFKREICFLALHGFLHLLGYDHIVKEDEEIMQSVAKSILEKNNIKR